MAEGHRSRSSRGGSEYEDLHCRSGHVLSVAATITSEMAKLHIRHGETDVLCDRCKALSQVWDIMSDELLREG